MSDPMVAAVGTTVLEVLERDKLDLRAAELGDHVHDRLTGLAQRHECIGDVRGRGLLIGLELVTDRTTKQGSDALGAAVTARCLKLGLHMNVVQLPGMGGVFRLAPPLTSSLEELDEGIDILDQAIGDVSNT